MSLNIIYSLIARGRKIILTDYTDFTGNFQQIALLVLKKLQKNTRCELTYDNYVIYSHDEDDVTYVCLADNMKTEVAFSYLADLKKKFVSTYKLAEIIQSFSYQMKDFASEIKTINRFYEENQHYSQVGVLKDKNNNPVEIIKENADHIFNNNDKLELIAKKSMKSREIHDDFQIKFDAIKRKQRAKYIKYAILLFIIISFISLILFGLSKLF